MNRNGSVFCGFLNNEHVVKKLKSIPNKSVSHIFYKCVYHTYLQRSICIFTHMSFLQLQWWLGIQHQFQMIYHITRVNWPLANSLMFHCVYLCVFSADTSIAQWESLRITDTFATFECRPKWVWTSFSSSLDLHFLGQHLVKIFFQGHSARTFLAILIIGLFRKQH